MIAAPFLSTLMTLMATAAAAATRPLTRVGRAAWSVQRLKQRPISHVLQSQSSWNHRVHQWTPKRRASPLMATVSSSSSSTPHSTPTSPPADWVELRLDFQKAVDLVHENLASTRVVDNCDWPSIEALLSYLQPLLTDLEQEQAQPEFWNTPQQRVVHERISHYRQLQTTWQQWQRWLDDGRTALEMLQEYYNAATSLSIDEHELLLDELRTATRQLSLAGQAYAVQLLLCGPHDQAAARLVITAGAGGTEANDWVADVYRMYQRHAVDRGYDVQVLDVQAAEVTGYKSVELVISATATATAAAPYGWFQGEHGTHRLVRLSPFNAQHKRQTTFCGVQVAPDLDETALPADWKIPEADLEIQALRSGGKGGQNVNKVSSAIRMRHVPTGLQVKVSQERSQTMNRAIALRRLRSQLLALAVEQRQSEIKAIRGDLVQASWGTQIRNYVLHPYQLVKDTRTGWESSNTRQFLDGDLTECITAYLRHKAAGVD
jgi:peptide chain release factor 2